MTLDTGMDLAVLAMDETVREMLWACVMILGVVVGVWMMCERGHPLRGGIIMLPAIALSFWGIQQPASYHARIDAVLHAPARPETTP